MDEPITLDGTIESVVFRNESNGWTVFEMACGDDLVTVVGSVFQIQMGEELRVMGEWVNHPNYGRQFKAETFERCIPATAAAMLKYLSSGALKGIGPSTAKRIVDTFGVETLGIIEKNPEKLTSIRGISPKKAQLIGEEYRKQFGIRTLMLFLQQYSVTTAESIRIYKRWGSNAADMIKQNPYILCGAGLWISFDRADSIASAMGISKNDPFRIGAGVLHILRHNLFQSGHTYIPYEKLEPTAAAMLEVPAAQVADAVDMLVGKEELVAGQIRSRRAIFLSDAYRAESYIAGRLSLMLMNNPPALGSCDERIRETEEKFHIHYASKQRLAIKTAYEQGLMILTGGPGTGKTTTLNAIIDVYKGMGLKVALAAPTGRAAQRMAEVSGQEAKTIHRLLEVEYNDGDVARFARNEKNLLDCDALIVDEVSMVDVMLFESLMRALKLGCRLVMVGDADQLPPVGAGNALKDMIDSGKVPIVELDEIFRQAAQSLIVLNAHKIVRGEMPDLCCRDRDFFFLPRFSADKVRETVVELVSERLPAAYGYSPFWDIQVLIPRKKGEIGTVKFNHALQQALNPAAQGRAERSVGLYTMRQGDKVMQIRNNYDLAWARDGGERGTGVFNGDVGVLESVDRKTGAMQVRFEDKVADYGPENADELELAYAMTVHKSQGSEFKAVVLPIFSGAPQLFYRNLLYTAVTRARELVIIVGREQSVVRMVENGRKTRRYTGLRFFLENGGGIQ